MLSIETLSFLASSDGTQLLDQLAHEDLSDSNTLALLTRLRQKYAAENAGAALTMARLRHKAVIKFGTDAQKMFFTPDALEQASDPQIRHYRAQAAAGNNVLDMCCSIGSDTLSLARTSATITGLDIDPIRIAIAQYNAAALGIAANFQVCDVTQTIPPNADMLFFDPARRDEYGKRLHDVEHYQPPLSLIQQWHAPLILVKLSPGVDLAQLKKYGGMVEFLSVDGDLKEALLWVGADFSGTKATLFKDNDRYYFQRTENVSVVLAQPRQWLVEPDPAILRAGLVQDIAANLNGTRLDETIAYFTTDTKPASPWIRAWQILDWMPYNLKKLRAYLQQHQVGQVTVKKRGSPIMPEELIRQLKLKSGSETRTLVLTRYRGQPIVLICADILP
jgi:SAM-dependent methyltransferase